MQSGLKGVESGALWLGTRAAKARLSAVVFPRGHGVLEEPQRWEVGHDVYGVISRWAFSRGLVMLGMAHIHTGPSHRMSWADRFLTVKAPEFLSVIMPRSGRSAFPDEWGWYICEDGDYRELDRKERTDRIIISEGDPVDIWIADGSDIRQDTP